MPRDTKSVQILQERAHYLATNEVSHQQTEGLVSYLQFRLGNESYGIPYPYAKEVIHFIKPTKVPFASNSILGVINRHGILVPVFDLKKLFHLESCPSENNYLILIQCNDMTIGFTVDNINENHSYEPSTLDATFNSEELIKSEYILGIHDGITAIINVEAILAELL